MKIEIGKKYVNHGGNVVTVLRRTYLGHESAYIIKDSDEVEYMVWGNTGKVHRGSKPTPGDLVREVDDVPKPKIWVLAKDRSVKVTVQPMPDGSLAGQFINEWGITQRHFWSSAGAPLGANQPEIVEYVEQHIYYLSVSKRGTSSSRLMINKPKTGGVIKVVTEGKLGVDFKVISAEVIDQSEVADD